MTEEAHSRQRAPMESQPDNVDVRRIAFITSGLVAIIVIVGVLVWFFSMGLRDQRIAKDPPPPALPEARLPYRPPGPQLQSDPIRELEVMRATEEAYLTSYGWVDNSSGIARIPVTRAMDLLLAEGLPEVVQSPPAGSDETDPKNAEKGDRPST